MDKEPQTDLQESGSLPAWRFNLHEFAGSLGDLGTLLPITMGLILINKMDATSVLLCVGLFYIISGLYFRVTTPVQPMKVIGAYAIAMGGIAVTPLQITTSGMLVGVMLLLLAATGAVTLAGRLVPKSTVRGVQMTTGILLMWQGIRLTIGWSKLQAVHGKAEPFLSVTSIGPIPIGIVIGVIAFVMVLLLLNNRKVPAALVVLIFGATAGLALGASGTMSGIQFGLHLPGVSPYGYPVFADLTIAMLVLALPQIPMTIGNAVIAQADLTKEYFGEAAKRSTWRGLAVSMGLANLVSALLGGMPMCHGSGGLAAHRRFGARTIGANLMIGPIFIIIAILFGGSAIGLLSVIPMSVYGVLLVFAGAQLAMTVRDVKEHSDMLVVTVMFGVAIFTNLAIGAAVGIFMAYIFKYSKNRKQPGAAS